MTDPDFRRAAAVGMAGTNAARLSSTERLILVVPLLGGATFGLAPYFADQLFASIAGYSGRDPYVYHLAGAATFGYAVALAIGFADRLWSALRPIVVATLVFNLVSIAACLIEIARGRAQPVVYLILATSIFISVTTAWLIRRKGGSWTESRDVASLVFGLVILATLAATVFGVLPQFVGTFASMFGYSGQDVFVYRQAGAATLGYAAMGVVELRAPRWEIMRLPTVMALVFNGMSAIASVASIAGGDATAITYLIGAASTAFMAAFIAVLVRHGR